MRQFVVILFLSFIVNVNLFGQVPMAVFGDVMVAGGASMYSMGALHVKTSNAGPQVGRIDNIGTLKTDTIILYSNDLVDGLLRNRTTTFPSLYEGKVGGLTTATPRFVVVRKSLPNDHTWYTFSMPFDLNIVRGSNNSGSVKLSETNTSASIWDNYGMAWYDADNRAIIGKDSLNWRMLDEDIMSVIPAGKAFRIRGVSGNTHFDFVTNDPVAIDSVFAYKTKTDALHYAFSGIWNDQYSYGWNIIGGRNVTTFTLSADNVEYAETGNPATLYYWNRGGVNSPNFNDNWSEYLLDPINPDTLILSPYVTFAVQTDANTKKFNFKPTGLSLEKSNPIGFRSLVQDDSRDVLYITLTDEHDNFDKAYIMFRDGFQEGFKILEDGLKLSTSDSEPRLWSLNESDGTLYSLFVNCLPRISERVVKLGLTTPSAGEYTFALKDLHNETVKTVVLWDKITGEETDLLRKSYTFQTNNAISANDRFVLYVNKTPTSIKDLEKVSEVYASANNNVLTVKNLLIGNKVQIYDLSGRLIASGVADGDEFTEILNVKGVYIVNVSGEKTSVLKVLNK